MSTATLLEAAMGEIRARWHALFVIDRAYTAEEKAEYRRLVILIEAHEVLRAASDRREAC